MLQKLLVLVLLLSLCPLANAQAATEKPLDKPDEKAAKVRTQAVAFFAKLWPRPTTCVRSRIASALLPNSRG